MFEKIKIKSTSAVRWFHRSSAPSYTKMPQFGFLCIKNQRPLIIGCKIRLKNYNHILHENVKPNTAVAVWNIKKKEKKRLTRGKVRLKRCKMRKRVRFFHPNFRITRCRSIFSSSLLGSPSRGMQHNEILKSTAAVHLQSSNSGQSSLSNTSRLRDVP